MRNVAAVASPANSSELLNCGPNLVSARSYARVEKVTLNPSSRLPDETDMRNIWIAGTTKNTSSHRMPGASRR